MDLLRLKVFCDFFFVNQNFRITNCLKKLLELKFTKNGFVCQESALVRN